MVAGAGKEPCARGWGTAPAGPGAAMPGDAQQEAQRPGRTGVGCDFACGPGCG